MHQRSSGLPENARRQRAGWVFKSAVAQRLTRNRVGILFWGHCGSLLSTKAVEEEDDDGSEKDVAACQTGPLFLCPAAPLGRLAVSGFSCSGHAEAMLFQSAGWEGGIAGRRARKA